mmetsp:Transcript_13029/g.26606  ORF Transcript_13029/g.26606 Transcript_13029/m.26606 type:complete len:243 (-) Transcript_13029:263-991(-)
MLRILLAMEIKPTWQTLPSNAKVDIRSIVDAKVGQFLIFHFNGLVEKSSVVIAFVQVYVCLGLLDQVIHDFLLLIEGCCPERAAPVLSPVVDIGTSHDNEVFDDFEVPIRGCIPKRGDTVNVVPLAVGPRLFNVCAALFYEELDNVQVSFLCSDEHGSVRQPILDVLVCVGIIKHPLYDLQRPARRGHIEGRVSRLPLEVVYADLLFMNQVLNSFQVLLLARCFKSPKGREAETPLKLLLGG